MKWKDSYYLIVIVILGAICAGIYMQKNALESALDKTCDTPCIDSIKLTFLGEFSSTVFFTFSIENKTNREIDVFFKDVKIYLDDTEVSGEDWMLFEKIGPGEKGSSYLTLNLDPIFLMESTGEFRILGEIYATGKFVSKNIQKHKAFEVTYTLVDPALESAK
ncbi:MAG: hypothetical protein ACXQTP_00100 [Candidatus Methanofastidiosia archaeon]